MRLESEGSDKEGLSSPSLFIEHLLCAGCYLRPWGLSVKKSVKSLPQGAEICQRDRQQPNEQNNE